MVIAFLLLLVAGVKGDIANLTSDFINVTGTPVLGSEYSCDDVDSCFINVDAECRQCIFNCPTTEDCIVCEIECIGDDACRQSTINSNECNEVYIIAESSIDALIDATVNGPMSGDLFISVIDSDNGVSNTEFHVNGTNNVEINVTNSRDSGMKVFGSGMTGTLTLNCEGSFACDQSQIFCPIRDELDVDGPNCFINCVGAACTLIEIDSAFGTPIDVVIDCGLDAGACGGTFIDCTDGDQCNLELTPSGSWTCSNTTCKTFTGAPTVMPSGQPTLSPTEITSEPSAMPIDASSTEAPPMSVTEDEATTTTTTGAGATEDDETTSSGEGMMTTDDPSLKDGGDKDNEFPVWVGVLIGIFVFLLLVCIIVLGISNRNKEKQQRSGRDLVPTVNEEEVPATSTGASAAETPKNEEEIELATDKGHAPAESGDDLYGDAAIGRSHTRGASEGGDPAVTGTTPAGGEEVQKDDAQIVGMQTAGAGENDKALNMLAGDDEKPANDAEPELQGGDEGPEEDDDDVLDGGITTGGGTGDGGDIGNTGGGDYAD